MVETAIANALRLYLSAKRKFDDGDFETASAYADQFHELNYNFATVELGSKFSWSKHAICLVAHKPLSATEHLLRSIVPVLADPEFCLVFVANASDDIFPYADDVTSGNYAIIRAGANFGASVGRNLAIHFCRSETITYLDDDGVTSPESLIKLVDTIQAYDAVAVRGRVLPLNNFEAFPKHYDLGNNLKQRFMDIEGITIWKTTALKRHRFDALLYGHEGIELTARLYCEYGPDAFLYQPEAILRHDFVKPTNVPAEKLERMKRNNEYLEFKNNDISSIRSVFYGLDSSTQSARSLSYRRQLNARKINGNRSVSIITTCFNAASHLHDYCDSLERQTRQDFEIVFVDDGSTDGSADIVAERFKGDSRLKLIKSDHAGRAAALNIAMNAVQTDIAMIADADDISVPQRVEWVQKAFDAYDPADAIGFTIFDTKTSARGSRPLVARPTPLGVRRFFGMPCPFPGLSFRPSAFSLPFDEALKAGIDCDWLHRNIDNRSLRGWYLPIPVSFYRTHDGQITTHRRDIQRLVSLNCVTKLHSSYLGELDPEDKEGLELFTGWRAITNGASWFKLRDYANKLIAKLDLDDVPDAEIIHDEILRHLEDRHLHLASMDYKKLKTKIDQTKLGVAATGSESTRIKELHSKLDWNRRRVKELEAELAKRPTADKYAKLEAKLLWNRARVKELESGLKKQRRNKPRWRVLGL